ncbi:type II toxin-antitoxin system RelE family toxin [Leptospira limi]|uniref:type II toxin-antitoxin system RelE family toxin n=1 Tax=Leptospira limi TaxID=2950023 RepID=UPI00389953D9
MIISSKASKYLKDLPKKDSRRIAQKIHSFKSTSNSNVKKIQGKDNCFRIRVGDFRILILKLDDGDFEVIDIGLRKDIYKSL